MSPGPLWTPETAPRNGGRRKDGKPKKPRLNPKQVREEAEQYLLLHLAPFLARLVSAAVKNPHGRAAALYLERAMPLLKDSEAGKIVLQKITLELSRDDDPAALRALLPSEVALAPAEGTDAVRCVALPRDAQLEPSSSELTSSSEKEVGLEPLPLSPDQSST